MHVVSVVGARPQFIKLAPVAEALTGHRHVIVHTGQHYDEGMSDVFFADLLIPAPDVHLGIGSASHGAQTGAMLAALDDVLARRPRPNWVLVYGDTNSTLAGALAAVKLGIPVAHLEAGLRSFNRRMPEEHNRVLTDHAADLLLAPTEVAMGHLAAEGLAARSRLVGDVMTDVCLRVAGAAAVRPPDLPVPQGGYVLATVHRAENTDDPTRLAAVVAALQSLPLPVVLAAHPRLVARCADFGIDLHAGAVRVVPPLPYPGLVAVLMHASAVVTDSGGLQKEAYLLGVPCTTLRGETEWTETLAGSWNALAQPETLAAVVTRGRPTADRPAVYGDGNAAGRVVATLAELTSAAT